MTKILYMYYTSGQNLVLFYNQIIYQWHGQIFGLFCRFSPKSVIILLILQILISMTWPNILVLFFRFSCQCCGQRYQNQSRRTRVRTICHTKWAEHRAVPKAFITLCLGSIAMHRVIREPFYKGTFWQRNLRKIAVWEPRHPKLCGMAWTEYIYWVYDFCLTGTTIFLH